MTDIARGTPLSLLIVDDSQMMRMMLKRMTTSTGIPIGQTFEAGNGREALEVLERERVDVLFTDINMPEMDGAELLRAVSARRDWDHMMRIVVSTDGSTTRRVELSTLNVRTCIEKPFQPEVVRDVLRELVAGR